MTPEARAARERKQKIFVVVGGLLLLAMLAFQLPKLLGGASTPEGAATTTDEVAVSGAPASVTPARVEAGTVRRTVGTDTKLTSFTVFAAKDPFVQQVVTTAVPGAATGGTGTQAGDKAQTPPQTFTTGTTSAAAVTMVIVNGDRQVLEPGMKFPAADPLFVLVAEKPSAKSVVVGIAGGSYSSGAKTTTLKVGKPVTLVNTATGARYKISLVSVGSGDSGEEPKQTP